MLRSTLRVLSALSAISALGCAKPTAPAPEQSRVTVPGASFDDITSPTDTTCRSGYIVAQGHSC